MSETEGKLITTTTKVKAEEGAVASASSSSSPSSSPKIILRKPVPLEDRNSVPLEENEDRKLLQTERPTKKTKCDSGSINDNNNNSITSDCNTKDQNLDLDKIDDGKEATMEQQQQTPTSITLYCICRAPYSPFLFMIQCEMCSEWFHGDCVGVTELKAEEIDQYHCAKCELSHGPSILKGSRKSKRRKGIPNYAELNDGIIKDEDKYKKILQDRDFPNSEFPRISSIEFTMDYVIAQGLKQPIIINDMEYLGMEMPSSSFTVDDVVKYIGADRPIYMIEVATQHEKTSWNLGKFAQYYNHPEYRKVVYNVISLEFSDTKLATIVKRPEIVQQLDWIDRFWPKELLKRGSYPKIQLYCLMSVANCFTDFHIDLGGTSVYYHILRGEKIFYFIEPSPENLRKYEKWTASPDQEHVFFADLVSECVQVHLIAGQTMIIPSGWIHAVYTPVDSLVIGGNFIHGLNIDMQLQIAELEERTHLPPKFRYPMLHDMLWYACQQYLEILTTKPNMINSLEIAGMGSLVQYLRKGLLAEMIPDSKKTSKPSQSFQPPPKIGNPHQLLKKLANAVQSYLASKPRTIVLKI